MARAPAGGHGKADLGVLEVDDDGAVQKAGILWGYKRNMVFNLSYLFSFESAARRSSGVELGLDADGIPVLRTRNLEDHVYKWCSQLSLFSLFSTGFRR